MVRLRINSDCNTLFVTFLNSSSRAMSKHLIYLINQWRRFYYPTTRRALNIVAGNLPDDHSRAFVFKRVFSFQTNRTSIVERNESVVVFASDKVRNLSSIIPVFFEWVLIQFKKKVIIHWTTFVFRENSIVYFCKVRRTVKSGFTFFKHQRTTIEGDPYVKLFRRNTILFSQKTESF